MARLWAYRETHTEAISAAGVPVKLDVSVPLRELAGLVDDLPGTVAAAAPGARVIIFGHLGEGNLHVNVLDAGRARRAGQRGGAAAGRREARQHQLRARRRPGQGARGCRCRVRTAEIAAMRRIKNALDPAGMLNPGVLLS